MSTSPCTAPASSVSLQDLAGARNTEAIVAQSYLIRLQEEAMKRNDTTEATRKEIQAAQQVADAKRAEAERSAATAQAKMIEVEAANAAAAAYQDNSARVYELRGAAAEAAREVERLAEAQKRGEAAASDVASAQARAASATALYRDAVRDASAAAERRITAERQAARITQTAISVDVERAQAQREVAEAMGDAAGAAEAQQQANLAQARAAEEAGAAARREAQAIREAADARERELRVLGQLTPEKQAEIDASRRSADAKELEGQKADILADKLRRLNGVLKEQVQLTRELSEEEQNLQRGRTRDGISVDQWGRKLQMGGELNTRTGIANFLKSAGVTDDDAARRVANEFADRRGDIQYFDNPGMRKYGGSTISESVLRAAERITFAGSGSDGGSRSSRREERGRTVRVDINMNGRARGSVTTDEAGEDVLRGVLRDLQASQSVAGRR